VAETPYSETEALLKAMADAEADSGNTDLLDEYLRSEFLPGELYKLYEAAELLAKRAYDIYREKRTPLARRGAPTHTKDT